MLRPALKELTLLLCDVIVKLHMKLHMKLHNAHAVKGHAWISVREA